MSNTGGGAAGQQGDGAQGQGQQQTPPPKPKPNIRLARVREDYLDVQPLPPKMAGRDTFLAKGLDTLGKIRRTTPEQFATLKFPDAETEAVAGVLATLWDKTLPLMPALGEGELNIGMEKPIPLPSAEQQAKGWYEPRAAEIVRAFRGRFVIITEKGAK